jgi:hypothetical protein
LNRRVPTSQASLSEPSANNTHLLTISSSLIPLNSLGTLAFFTSTLPAAPGAAPAAVVEVDAAARAAPKRPPPVEAAGALVAGAAAPEVAAGLPKEKGEGAGAAAEVDAPVLAAAAVEVAGACAPKDNVGAEVVVVGAGDAGLAAVARENGAGAGVLVAGADVVAVPKRLGVGAEVVVAGDATLYAQ